MFLKIKAISVILLTNFKLNWDSKYLNVTFSEIMNYHIGFHCYGSLELLGLAHFWFEKLTGCSKSLSTAHLLVW